MTLCISISLRSKYLALKVFLPQQRKALINHNNEKPDTVKIERGHTFLKRRIFVH